MQQIFHKKRTTLTNLAVASAAPDSSLTRGSRSPMEMHQIRYFLALCEKRSFTRAAKSCGVSQPSLTNGIKALEEELGGDLFTRRPNIAVTRLGSTVRPRLTRIVQDAEKVLEMARSLRSRSVALVKGAGDEPPSTSI